MPAPTVLVSGLGLMGGSLAAALSAAGWRVLLHHRRAEVARRAQDLGYGHAVDDAPAAVGACALAVVCVPVEATAPLVRALASAPGAAVITDVGSAKGALCGSLADLAAAGRFVGSHPMAGSHLQGLEHARSDLYRGCVSVVTPTVATPPSAVETVAGLWRAVGARVLRLDPDAHDDAVAAASHVPHVLASAAAAGLDDGSAPLAATGFRDTTRVAAGSPDLWTGILIANRAAVAQRLRGAAERLATLADALDGLDADAVRGWLEEGRTGRLRYEQQTRAAHP